MTSTKGEDVAAILNPSPSAAEPMATVEDDGICSCTCKACSKIQSLDHRMLKLDENISNVESIISQNSAESWHWDGAKSERAGNQRSQISIKSYGDGDETDSERKGRIVDSDQSLANPVNCSLNLPRERAEGLHSMSLQVTSV